MVSFLPPWRALFMARRNNFPLLSQFGVQNLLGVALFMENVMKHFPRRSQNSCQKNRIWKNSENVFLCLGESSGDEIVCNYAVINIYIWSIVLLTIRSPFRKYKQISENFRKWKTAYLMVILLVLNTCEICINLLMYSFEIFLFFTVMRHDMV